MPAQELLESNCNLDRKNPNAAVDEDDGTPRELIDRIIENERQILELMSEIRRTVLEADQ